mmetsp:Transcript_81448/g.195411  ORF Transcript_81448/g.195411 Transcript_81448/m.195411 type:complete len:239 (-) Transcript_81448:605-1321(-)
MLNCLEVLWLPNLHHNLFLGPSNKPDGVGAVEEHPAFAPDGLRLRVGFASFAVSRVVVHEGLRVAGSRQSDVALLTPARAPGIPDQPVVLGVADRLNPMVQGVVRSFAAARENASAIQLPRPSSHGYRHGALRGQSSLQRSCLVDGEPDIALRLHRGLVAWAGCISALVGKRALQSNTLRDGQVEGQLHGRSLAAPGSSAIIRVFHAVHVRLRSQRQQLARCDRVVGLDRLGSRECPA